MPSPPLYVDTAGRVYHSVFEFVDGATDWWVVRFGYGGVRGDSLHADRWQYDTPRLEVRYEQGGNRRFSVANVPFTASGAWTFSPRGYLVAGVSTEYRFELMRPAGPGFRIDRHAEPVLQLDLDSGSIQPRPRRPSSGWGRRGRGAACPSRTRPTPPGLPTYRRPIY